MATKKYLSLERLEEYDSLIKGTIDSGDAAVKSYVDTELAKKANSSHNHDDRYYTESEVDTKISGVNSSITTHTENSDIHVAAANKTNWNSAYTHSTSAHAPSNAEKNIVVGIQKNGTDLTVDSSTRKVNITVPTTAAEVGAAPSNHNHDDKYDTKGAANTALDSAKTYADSIKKYTSFMFANNVSTFAGAPSGADNSNTGEVHAGTSSDSLKFIAGNNLISFDVTDYNGDGVDSVAITINADPVGSADEALEDAKSYADTKIAALINGAPTTLDTIGEIAVAMEENAGVVEALEAAIGNKANATHSHAISDVSGLQSALDGKAAASHGTHVSYSTTAPVMDGTASVGTASTVARSDHKHPTDTSRASKTEFDTHVADTTKHITSTERTNWGAAYTHSQAAHAPSNAEKNQNAFSNVTVGSTTIAADTTTDTLTLVAGTNVTITPDATNDKITISATDTVYTHPNSDVTAGTYRSVTVNAQGHVTGGSNPTTLSGYGITDAASKTHGHAISDITNLQSTLNNAASAISTNTSSIDAHTGRISALESKVGDGFEEITSAEIQALFSNKSV